TPGPAEGPRKETAGREATASARRRRKKVAPPPKPPAAHLQRQTWRKSYGPCKPIFRARDGPESSSFCCSGSVACQTVIFKRSLQTALVEVITAKGQPSISLKKFGAPVMLLCRHALILR